MFRNGIWRQPQVHTDGRNTLGGVGVQRLIQRGAEQGLLRVGLRPSPTKDIYHRALRLPWSGFLLLITGVYLTANLAFGFLYWLQPGAIANARPGSFRDAFFFSVETFGTIGYGTLAPATDYANTVMTAETLCGIMLVALTTGVMFARVSRPTARVLFSKVAVVAPYNGAPTLMVRTGNERLSQILQAEVAMTLVRNEHTREGTSMRRFYDLALARDHTPIFAMSFLVMHTMDETSPLFGATRQTLEEMEAEILITVTGLDETMSQTVHARASYLPHEILLNHRYANMFGVTDDGRRAIDYGQFHRTEPLG
ncbi:MAG: ATP-sensitive inward rectifier potassium channel 10 [Acetobacteraceae bacterium]|nr:ATP-sensitive inward rectifier potassium channel 10 [Acetobacteraceae bacterium]